MGLDSGDMDVFLLLLFIILKIGVQEEGKKSPH
jgi:hypothetical protein